MGPASVEALDSASTTAAGAFSVGTATAVLGLLEKLQTHRCKFRLWHQTGGILNGITPNPMLATTSSYSSSILRAQRLAALATHVVSSKQSKAGENGRTTEVESWKHCGAQHGVLLKEPTSHPGLLELDAQHPLGNFFPVACPHHGMQNAWNPCRFLGKTAARGSSLKTAASGPCTVVQLATLPEQQAATTPAPGCSARVLRMYYTHSVPATAWHRRTWSSVALTLVTCKTADAAPPDMSFCPRLRKFHLLATRILQELSLAPAS